MKLPILLLFLTSAIVSADERNSVTVGQQVPPRAAAPSVSQQLEEADISLAVAHYKRLKEKANELRLELALREVAEPPFTPPETEEISKKKRDEYSALHRRLEKLDDMANKWRAAVEARFNKSASAK